MREDPAAASSRMRALCDFLATRRISAPEVHARRTPISTRVIDVRAMFQQGHRELQLEAMPRSCCPQKGRYGLRDYEKMFCPDLKSGNDIFDMRGIDRERGCMVVVRPDQYVAHVLPLDAYADLSAFFAGSCCQRLKRSPPRLRPSIRTTLTPPSGARRLPARRRATAELSLRLSPRLMTAAACRLAR